MEGKLAVGAVSTMGNAILRTALAGLLLAAVATAAPPSEAAQADFLRRARIATSKKLSEGVTQSRRATLQMGGISHEAHVQTVDAPEEHDSYRNNLAAFALGEVLGLDSIPVTVQRAFERRPASFTWWIDDVLMNEETRLAKAIKPPDTQAWNRQVYQMKVFDLLIHNDDRNMGNVIIDKSWKLWMIDHSHAFQPEHVLHDPADVIRCDRVLLARMRALDATTLQPILAPWLSSNQIEALLIRRDLIVKAFQARVAEKGEDEVLYDHLPAR